MGGFREKESEPIVLQLGNQAAALEVDLAVFSLPAVLRACYKFTDRAYFHLARAEEPPESVVVTVGMKGDVGSIGDFMGSLCNELLDQQIRQNLAEEAGPVRTLIVAKAFSEGNLLDVDQDSCDYESDPLDIGRQR